MILQSPLQHCAFRSLNGSNQICGRHESEWGLLRQSRAQLHTHTQGKKFHACIFLITSEGSEAAPFESMPLLRRSLFIRIRRPQLFCRLVLPPIARYLVLHCNGETFHPDSSLVRHSLGCSASRQTTVTTAPAQVNRSLHFLSTNSIKAGGATDDRRGKREGEGKADGRTDGRTDGGVKLLFLRFVRPSVRLHFGHSKTPRCAAWAA